MQIRDVVANLLDGEMVSFAKNGDSVRVIVQVNELSKVVVLTDKIISDGEVDLVAVTTKNTLVELRQEWDAIETMTPEMADALRKAMERPPFNVPTRSLPSFKNRENQQ
jgi:hypothetical protein